MANVYTMAGWLKSQWLASVAIQPMTNVSNING